VPDSGSIRTRLGAPGDDSAVADPGGTASAAARECTEIRDYATLPFNRVPHEGVSVGVRVGVRYGCIRLTDERSTVVYDLAAGSGERAFGSSQGADIDQDLAIVFVWSLRCQGKRHRGGQGRSSDPGVFESHSILFHVRKMWTECAMTWRLINARMIICKKELITCQTVDSTLVVSLGRRQ